MNFSRKALYPSHFSWDRLGFWRPIPGMGHRLKLSIPGVGHSPAGKGSSVVPQEGSQAGWLSQHATLPPPLPAAGHRRRRGGRGERGRGWYTRCPVFPVGMDSYPKSNRLVWFTTSLFYGFHWSYTGRKLQWCSGKLKIHNFTYIIFCIWE